jgi:hypothetical protein
MPRKWIRFMIGCLLLLPVNSLSIERKEQIKGFEDRIREVLASGVLPIIDVEYHHGGKIEIDRLIKKMDENGVAMTWLGQNENLGSEESLRINASYAGRIVPTTVHGDGPLWHGGNKVFLAKLAEDARSGKYFAMGEFEARHYPSDTNNRDVHMPVDSETMQVVFQASSDTGIPFLLHHEAEDKLLPELERMLVKYPKAKVVWCHVGRNRNSSQWKKFRTADAIRDLLKKYPNLYFDLVQSRPGSKYHGTGQVEGIMYDVLSERNAVLGAEWKKLFEEFPDRFVIGSDINTGRFNNYDRVIGTFRSVVLFGLRKDVAEKIAYRNAWKLMSGEDWRE